MKLPAGLSASDRGGATLSAMVGDQSRSMRGEVKGIIGFPEDLYGDGKSGAGDLALKSKGAVVELFSGNSVAKVRHQ